MFFNPLFVAAVAGLVSSKPLASRGDPGAFSLIAIRPGSILHNYTVTASESKFWLNKRTSSECLPNLGSACPAGNVTAFAYGNYSGTFVMDVEVESGQQAYITPSGEFGYTMPHALPPSDALTTGFKYTAPTANSTGSLTYGNGPQGFVACPYGNGTVHHVLATNGTRESLESLPNCLRIELAAVPYSGSYGAWEYQRLRRASLNKRRVQ